MNPDMIFTTVSTVILAIGSLICSILLAILLGIGGWTLITVVKFGNRLATMEQFLRDLPCSNCRYGNGKARLKK